MNSNEIREPTGLVQVLEELLKRPEELAEQICRDGAGRITMTLLWCGLAGFLAYGVLMGSFSGHPQWLWSAAKVPGGMLLCGLLCFPSLFIFSCLSGAEISLGQTVSLLVGGLTLTAVLLIGFLPVVFIFSCSTHSVSFMGFIHLLIWVVSFVIGIRFLQRGIRMFTENRSHLLVVWCFVLLLTMVQMSTTLRPLVGSSQDFITPEKKFFLVHWGETADHDINASDTPDQGGNR